MNLLSRLAGLGTSVWVDGLVPPDELDRLVREDAVTGLTSNPTIFRAAVLGKARYAERIVALGDQPPAALYEALAIKDVRAAADVLAPDGYVSLEVAPALAHHADATVAAARDLWARVNRPNAIIKIPATPAGVDAIRRVIADGINVNVTLLFGLDAQATALFGGERFTDLRRAGAHPQRVLWASTGTKDARYSDVKYVEELAGPGVVNTMPPATLAAFHAHGRVADALTGSAPAARAALDEVAAASVDLNAVTARLLDEGVAAFAASMDELLAGLAPVPTS